MNLDKQASKRMNCKVKFVNFEILIFIVNRQQKFPDFEQKCCELFTKSAQRPRDRGRSPVARVGVSGKPPSARKPRPQIGFYGLTHRDAPTLLLTLARDLWRRLGNEGGGGGRGSSPIQLSSPRPLPLSPLASSVVAAAPARGAMAGGV